MKINVHNQILVTGKISGKLYLFIYTYKYVYKYLFMYLNCTIVVQVTHSVSDIGEKLVYFSPISLTKWI